MLVIMEHYTRILMIVLSTLNGVCGSGDQPSSVVNELS